MDADIARLYDEQGVRGVRPRYSMALVRLHHRGPMTISELTEQIEVTHSAMSQTVAAMRRDGLVKTSAGADRRARQVSLTARGRKLVPFLEQEWHATERAIADLEHELPYPLTSLAADLANALEQQPFLARVKAHLPPGDPTHGGR